MKKQGIIDYDYGYGDTSLSDYGNENSSSKDSVENAVKKAVCLKQDTLPATQTSLGIQNPRRVQPEPGGQIHALGRSAWPCTPSACSDATNPPSPIRIATPRGSDTLQRVEPRLVTSLTPTPAADEKTGTSPQSLFVCRAN
ncbi:hypothetical protein [Amycolatopsis sp. NPDC051061]|uniref:hypothetical protein n=1 Tax=Amycolatopsis sp. NPDC051061 TaxID=3155042 RepID=UPI00341C0049